MIWALLFILNIFSVSSQALDEIPDPLIEKIRFGPEIAWFPSTRVPLVDFVLIFRAGSLYDPPGKSGTAALLSKILEHDPLTSQVEKLGGSLSVAVNNEKIYISTHGLSRDSLPLMKIALGIAKTPTLDRHVFEREKNRMLENWNLLGDSIPFLANFWFERLMESGSPYARGNSISPREVEAIRYEDVVSFHRKNLIANDSLLVAVGDLDPEKLRPEISSSILGWRGEIKGSKIPQWTLNRAGKTKNGDVWLVPRPGSKQTEIRIGFPVSDFLSPERDALSVLNSLFGGMFTGRLLTELREKMGIVYGAESGIQYRVYQSYFWISTATANSTVFQAYDGIKKMLQGLDLHPPTDLEIRSAKDFLLGSFPISLRTLPNIAIRWLGLRDFGLEMDFINSYSKRINGISKTSLDSAIDNELKNRKLTVVFAGDEKEILPLLRVGGLNVSLKPVEELRSLRVSASNSRSIHLPKRHPAKP